MLAAHLRQAQLQDRMNALLFANTSQANAMALNFLDNHDTPRFLRASGGNTDKLVCALLAMVIFPGMPCVFYGTELPLDGAGDPDCRKPFDWTFQNQSEEYKQNFRAILGLKKQAALTGVNAEISAEKGILKISRETDGECLTAYFNTSGKAKTVNAEGEILFAFNYKNNKILNNGTVVVKNKKGKI